MSNKILNCPICNTRLKESDGCKAYVWTVCPNCGYEKKLGE